MEGQTSIRELIKFSWVKSREVLFPFNFKRWLQILIIVSLAGAGVQGMSSNFNRPGRPAKPGMEKTSQAPSPGTTSAQGSPVASPEAQATSQAGTSGTAAASAAGTAPASQTPVGNTKPGKPPVWVRWLAGGGMLFGLVAAVFFMWVSSRFNFILLGTVTTGDAAIRGPFREHREIANSYFKWSLAFLGIILGTFLILGLVSFMVFGIVKGHMGWIALLGALAGLLGLAFFLAMIAIGHVMRDLVLPIMYRDKLTAMDALNRFLRADTFAVGKVFRYLLAVFGLGIVAAIAQGIVAILAGLGGVTVGGLLTIPGIFLIKALPLLKLPLLVLGALGAIAIVLAVIVVTGMVMLPVAIFFRAFALVYLTRLYPDCDLLGFTGREP